MLFRSLGKDGLHNRDGEVVLDQIAALFGRDKSVISRHLKNVFKEGELADFRKDSKENRYWLSNFTRSYTNGSSPEEVLKFEETVNAVTAKDIQDIAKKYLTKDKVIGMLMPEKK